MSKKCYACSVDRRSSLKRLQLFRFPKDRKRGQLWIENSGFHELNAFQPLDLHDTVCFCSEHFESKEFKNSNLLGLNKNAVPTLFRSDLPPRNLPCEFRSKRILAEQQQKRQISSDNINYYAASAEDSGVGFSYISDPDSPSDSSHRLSYTVEELKEQTSHTTSLDTLHFPPCFVESLSKPSEPCSASLLDSEVTPDDLETNISESVYKERARILFRRLCSTPLKLPSTLWTCVRHPDGDYLLICQLSYANGFAVDRGVRFTPEMLPPDVVIAGRKVELTEIVTLKTVSDVEGLIYKVDQMNRCPGTGLQRLPFSKLCFGISPYHPYKMKPVQSCIPCNTIKLANAL